MYEKIPIDGESSMNEVHEVPSGKVLGQKIENLLGAFTDVIAHIQIAQKQENSYEEYFEHVSRPDELLTVLLDLLRVSVEPACFGTFFLNCNMGFLLEQFTSLPCQIGYASVISKANKDFASCWHDEVLPYLVQLGYQVGNAKSMYVVVSNGPANNTFDFLVEATEVMGSGFSVEDAVAAIKGEVERQTPKLKLSTFAGFCGDDSLGIACRVSVLILLGE